MLRQSQEKTGGANSGGPSGSPRGGSPRGLGAALSAREYQAASQPQQKQQQKKQQQQPQRVSSPGIVLRRGSQVLSAARTQAPVTTVYNRQYKHARELEGEMIRTEEELAITKSELSLVSSNLLAVQNELDQRTNELAASRGKVDSLLRMVKHVLQHLVEKREARRFSLQASKELQRQIAEPLSKSFGSEDSKMSDYVEERIQAIDAILPQWSSVYGSGYNDSAPTVDFGDEESETSSMADYDEVPPPLPPGVTLGRRNSPPRSAGGSEMASANIPLPLPPPGAPPGARRGATDAPPSKQLQDNLLEVWDRIDEEEDGVLSFNEIRAKLCTVVPGVSLDLRDDILEKLNEGALISHPDGNAAFEEDQFVQALSGAECGKQLAKLVKKDLAGGNEHVTAHAKNISPQSDVSSNSRQTQKLNEWSRKMSTHDFPRSIHQHNKKGYSKGGL